MPVVAGDQSDYGLKVFGIGLAVSRLATYDAESEKGGLV